MINPFNRKSIYFGTSMQEFSAIRELLTTYDIRYTYQVRDRLGQWSGRGTIRAHLGSVGIRPELQYEYEVFVHKDDYEAARYRLSQLHK